MLRKISSIAIYVFCRILSITLMARQKSLFIVSTLVASFASGQISVMPCNNGTSEDKALYTLYIY